MDVFGIMQRWFDFCYQILNIDFYVAGLSFTLWDVFVVAALLSGAGLILAAGMGEE